MRKVQREWERGAERKGTGWRAWKRAAAAGLTLVELVIVITIVGVLGGAIAFGVVKNKQKADIGIAKTYCERLKQTTLTYLASHPGADCPTPEQLKAEKEIESSTNLNDPWGKPYKLSCEGDEIQCISSGPDRKEGTDDDIYVPPLQN